jgi:hypothetical protein
MMVLLQSSSGVDSLHNRLMMVLTPP